MTYGKIFAIDFILNCITVRGRATIDPSQSPSLERPLSNPIFTVDIYLHVSPASYWLTIGSYIQQFLLLETVFFFFIKFYASLALTQHAFPNITGIKIGIIHILHSKK